MTGFGFPYTVDPGILRATDNIAVPSSNTGIYLRVRDSGPISKIGVKIGTQGTNISLAVYRNSGKGRLAVPGARIATTGAVTCPVAGYAEVSLGSAVWVREGDWLAVSADTTVATFGSLLAAGADNNIGLGRQFRQSTAHPLPSTPGTLVATVGYAISLVGVR